MSRIALAMTGMLMALGLAACGSGKSAATPASNNTGTTGDGTGTGSDTGTGTVSVSWAVNRESTVNKSGGGYKVYYSRTSGFAIASAHRVDVPYVSGASAPTSTTLTSLGSGTWYVRVAAYSSLGTSVASSQTSVRVP